MHWEKIGRGYSAVVGACEKELTARQLLKL
jgi:hypothetical protein